MMRTYFAALCLAFGLLAAGAPLPQSATEAYEHVQKHRKEAEALWSQGNPEGLQAVRRLLQFAEQPLVRDLAQSNVDLAAEVVNVRIDLAKAYAASGNPDKAIESLRQISKGRSDPGLASAIEQMKAFASLRERQDFKDAVQALRFYEQFWDSQELATPYKANLSDAEKIAGLSKFWSEVKYNFGFPEKLLALQWDRLYLETIPKVLATKSTDEYYLELAKLCGQLSDGHTNIYPPRQFETYGVPPLRTRLVEGRVMILDVLSPKVAQPGVVAGTEIVAVDGQPVLEYAAQRIAPWAGGATPHDHELKTFGYALLLGPKDQPVHVSIRTAKGEESVVSMTRFAFSDLPWPKPVEWKELPGQIGYVALNDFSNSAATQQWRDLLPRIQATQGLILDLRWNGGGSSDIAYEILATLVDKPFLTSRQVMRTYNPTLRAWGAAMTFTETPAARWQPALDNYGASKPIVVLTSPATYSAAEDFMVAWKNSGRGKTVGEPTGGSTGQPLFIKLPGGGSARICTKKDTFPDGREWVNKGIEPDVPVQPTVAGVRSATDPILETALKLVRSGAK